MATKIIVLLVKVEGVHVKLYSESWLGSFLRMPFGTSPFEMLKEARFVSVTLIISVDSLFKVTMKASVPDMRGGLLAVEGGGVKNEMIFGHSYNGYCKAKTILLCLKLQDNTESWSKISS